MDRTCNGWTNYETWVTALLMGNNQNDQEFFFDMAKEVIAVSISPSESITKEDAELIDLSAALKEHFEDCKPDINGVYADLLNAALSEVNWREIAESLLIDVKSEDK